MQQSNYSLPERNQHFLNKNPFATDTLIQDNQENLIESYDDKISCFFTEINDLAEDLKYTQMQPVQDANKESLYKNKPFNCTCQLQEKGLMIMSIGGSSFHLPLEQDVQAVYPMTEGLILQFSLKSDSNMSGKITLMHIYMVQDNLAPFVIKSIQQWEEFYNYGGKGDSPNGIEGQFFSYVTINKHPLNALKVLGMLKRSDESIIPWIESSEQICYVSKELPILVSYNRMHQRHAIHVIRANIEESVRENTRLQLSSNFYSLSGLSELGDQVPLSVQVVTEVFFEESIKVKRMEKCQIIKTGNLGEFLIAMLIFDTTCYLKLYSLSFVNHTQTLDSTNFQVNALKNFVIINDVLDFFPINLFRSQFSVPLVADLQKSVSIRLSFNDIQLLQQTF